MGHFEEPRKPPVAYATAAAAVIGASYVAGKAARDALFLTYFEPTSLPPMIIGTAVFSIFLVAAGTRSLGRVSPGTYVPLAFAASAMLLLLEWALTFVVPRLAAPVVYLHVSGLGPLLGSGFWLIASERFDPRTAKHRFGQIGGAGTMGGLAGGIAAARLAGTVDVVALLPLLAAFNAVSAWQARALAHIPGETASTGHLSRPVRSVRRALAEAPYLRNLAVLMLLGSIAAALVDYVFKVQVKATFVRGSSLGSFFSVYYAAVSFVTFALQTFGSRAVLEKLGLGAAMSAPSLGLVAAGAASVAFPGLRSVIGARATETVFRGSLLRSAYEVFYTPVPVEEKRAVKTALDVGVDRSGDIIGAGVVQLLLWAPPSNLSAVLMWLAIGCSLAALLVVRRVSRGYVDALERSLLERAVELDVSDIEDHQTRTIVLRTLYGAHAHTRSNHDRQIDTLPVIEGADSEIQDIVVMRSRDADGARRILHRETGPSAALVPHVIPLLGVDALASDAVRALRTIAEEHVGALTDALVDPNQPFVVRRRLARVFSVCASQRATDGLLLGLEDLRFEVRFQCGRSLSAIVARNPGVKLDPSRVLDIVRREVAVSHSVWESRQVIDGTTHGFGEPSSLEALVGDRASRALEHVFTLLGLVLPAEPLRIAFRGLHTTDPGLRGTALEYLQSVLPSHIREHLWPFLDEGAAPGRATRRREDVLDDLLRSNQSILLDLQGHRTRLRG